MVKIYTMIIMMVMCLNAVIAQPIHIPYRVKSLWGISDEKGKILVKPAYDQVLFLSDEVEELPPGFYFVKRNNKMGLVFNKEMIPPMYKDIRVSRRTLVIAKNDESKNKIFLTLEGKSILPDSLKALDMEWLKVGYDRNAEMKTFIVALFHVKLPDGRNGCYFYHQKNPKSSRLLHTGYDRINYRKYEDPTAISIYLRNSSGYKNEIHYVLDDEKLNLIEVPFAPVEKRKDKNDNSYEVRETREGDEVAVMVEPEDHRFKPTSKNRFVRYKWENDSLYAYYMPSVYGPVERYISKFYIPLPAGAHSVKIQEVYGENHPSFKKNDTTYYYSGFVLFKTANQQGLLSKHYVQSWMFDSLQMLRYRGDNNYDYVFGLKNEQGKMHYGIKSIHDSTILPPVYEYIGAFESGLHQFNGKTNQYIVQQNKRWGIVDHSGTQLVPSIYDSIYSRIGKEVGIPFRVLVKGKMYGVYLNSTSLKESVELREPFTKYPPTRMVFIIQHNANYLTLLQHTDADGKLIGLSGKNGMVYWRD